MSIRQVYTTTDYDRFKTIEANRCITPSHAHKLALSTARTEGNVQPVIVDKYMNVLDGQHRLVACKAAGVPVCYLVSISTLSNSELMVELNVNSRNWFIGDYLDHWIALGGENAEGYKVIRDMSDSYEIGVESALVLCQTPSSNLRRGEIITVPARAFLLAKATQDYKAKYSSITGANVRTQAVANAVVSIENRIDDRTERGEHKLINRWNYSEAIEKLHLVMTEEGVSENPKTLRNLLSEAYDYKRPRHRRLSL